MTGVCASGAFNMLMAGFRRAVSGSSSAIGGSACVRPRCGAGFFTFLSALAILTGLGADVLARDGRSRGGGYGGFGDFERDNREAARRQQAEMERARREQEQAQKRQMREMEAAQAKNGGKGNGWGQDNDWGKGNSNNGNGWGNGNQGNNQGSQDREPSKDSAQPRRDDDQNGKPKTAEKERDGDTTGSADDWNLTEAERRVHAIGRARGQDLAKAQRQNDDLRRKEQERDARIRERSLRLKHQLDTAKAVTRLPPAQPAKPAPIVPAVAVGSPQPTEAVQRRGKVLDGLQSQASRLGVGRNGDGPSGEATDPSKSSVADRALDPAGAKDASGSSSSGAPAGGEKVPPAAASAPQGTLVVSGLSPTELEAAKAKGFAVSEDIDLKGSGATVRRVSARGFTDEELERELHKMAPFSQTVPNHEYSIYLGTIGESENASRAITQASSQPCPQKTCFGSQLIKWTSALTSCTKNVKIGIIDTSFDTDHPAFKRLRPIQGEFLGDERPSRYDWHGTAVLSVLAGDPQSGTPGLVPDATFMLATAFRSDVNGNATTDTVNLLRALDWLDQLDVDIVNMSFSGPKDEALARAIARMSKKGIVFIAAAGNMGPTASPSYPAAYPNVIAVTAINRKGVSYKSANRGSYIDISAPGVDILTALPDAKQGYRTGTSFAVPFVTAILATKVGERSQWAGRSTDPLDHVPKRDLGPPGQDPIYGAGLALAPPRCAASDEKIAQDSSPVFGAWSTETTSAGTRSEATSTSETTSTSAETTSTATEATSTDTTSMEMFIKAGTAFAP